MSKPFTRRNLTFDELVADIRKAAPGRVTVVTYAGLKFALECGIDVWEFAETYTLQAVIRDHGTPKQKQRLKEELLAGRWATAINMMTAASPAPTREEQE
jgi:hypothetical protein